VFNQLSRVVHLSRPGICPNDPRHPIQPSDKRPHIQEVVGLEKKIPKKTYPSSSFLVHLRFLTEIRQTGSGNATRTVFTSPDRAPNAF